jgi:uncharacterized protein
MNVKRNSVDAFLDQKSIAVYGVSRSGKKFGNIVYKHLAEHGYHAFPVNPYANRISDDDCYPNISAIPEKVTAAVLVIKPEQTEIVVRELADAGISYIWMQQGSESEEAVRYCEENGISVVHGHCILMFAEPVRSVHKFHHWVWKVIGKLPQ